MLPSVSAGSAALTNYAKAIAAAAPDQAAQDGDTAPHTEQDAARHNADPRTAHAAESGALAREARETVERVLETMRLRVLTALLDLDIPHPVASAAAQTAAAELANAISVDGRHAAEIVHALLERSLQTKSDPTASLLLMTARNLTVILDHDTGEVRIDLPATEIKPVQAPGPGLENHHLIDFTDRSPAQAAPALAALAAVQETARNAAASPASSSGEARTLRSALRVEPAVFRDTIADRLTVLVKAGAITPTIPIPDVTIALSQIAAATFAGSPVASEVPVAEVVSSLSLLEKVNQQPTANATSGGILLSHGRVSVAADLQSGAVTLRIGQRVTAFAPASLSNPATAQAPLPQLDVLPLPIQDIPASLPVGKVVDIPGGLPFVPPEISDLPTPGTPPAPAQTPDAGKANRTANATPASIENEPARMLDPAALKNATVVKQVEISSQGEQARLTRVSLDMSAEISPGAHAAQQPAPVGGFGLPRPAPATGEDGPIVPRGFTDASANLIPVLPAFHSRGLLPEAEKKAKPRKLPKNQYDQVLLEDSFRRDTPEGHEGLVFSAVVFTA